ncbi:MAG: glycoside hydrolase family 19 protein, partial [Acidobacteriota bacterium]
MQIEKDLLTSLGVTNARAERYLPDLDRALPPQAIDTPLRVAHFLSQVLHESARMRLVVENLNYSADALLRVFKKHFTESEAQSYARQPEKIGNRAYADRLGNGPESSGDGFRYRGRGLIQLTGKTNYGKFAQWIDDGDVLAEPDRVAERYAVDSAVYYWATHNLNALADLDDVTRVTRAINGGVNGLDDRMMLLDQAKTALGLTQPVAILEGATHRVSVAELNLRNQPRVSSSTRIGSLHEGAEVERLGDASVPDWWQIRTLLSERLVEGFVAFRFLEALPQQAVSLESDSLESASLEGASLERVALDRVSRTFVPPPFDLPETHLRESRREVTRQEDGYRAFPLGEKGKPRRSGTLAETKARQLGKIVDYLDSESAEHRRYWPKRGTTFCNIYAYDYCYLAGVFLPRVWWTERA